MFSCCPLPLLQAYIQQGGSGSSACALQHPLSCGGNTLALQEGDLAGSVSPQSRYRGTSLLGSCKPMEVICLPQVGAEVPWDEEIDFHTPSLDIVHKSSCLQEVGPSSCWTTLMLSHGARPFSICDNLHLPCEYSPAHNIENKKPYGRLTGKEKEGRREGP